MAGAIGRFRPPLKTAEHRSDRVLTFTRVLRRGADSTTAVRWGRSRDARANRADHRQRLHRDDGEPLRRNDDASSSAETLARSVRIGVGVTVDRGGSTAANPGLPATAAQRGHRTTASSSRPPARLRGPRPRSRARRFDTCRSKSGRDARRRAADRSRRPQSWGHLRADAECGSLPARPCVSALIHAAALDHDPPHR
jgi:hypothetical protein